MIVLFSRPIRSVGGKLYKLLFKHKLAEVHLVRIHESGTKLKPSTNNNKLSLTPTSSLSTPSGPKPPGTTH